jgi:hypothetical protein
MKVPVSRQQCKQAVMESSPSSMLGCEGQAMGRGSGRKHSAEGWQSQTMCWRCRFLVKAASLVLSHVAFRLVCTKREIPGVSSHYEDTNSVLLGATL